MFDDSMVEARDLHFGFYGRKIYSGLNLQIPRGKVTVIMGPSGCGKSTFLGLLGGRLPTDKGSILFDGEPIAKPRSKELYKMRRKMGMLFQNSALLTDINVFDNVAFPLREQTNLPEKLIETIVLMKLELVGLRGTRDLKPAQLSGGMARRVALARSIAMDPKLVMYDEPFVGLDPISMAVVVQLIRELNDSLGLTSVVVTHDVAEGLSIADHVCLLGNGKLAGQGSPDEMLNSNDEGIRQFLKGLPDGPVAYHYPSNTSYLDELGGVK